MSNFLNYWLYTKVKIFFQLHCCGVNGTSDWLKHIPRSCCLELPQYEECTVKDSFEKGCFDLIYTFIENNAVLMISIAAGVALIQVGFYIFELFGFMT